VVQTIQLEGDVFMHKNDDKKHRGRGFAISVLFGTAVGFFLVLVLFAILASVIASGKISEDMMRFVVIAAAFLGALAGAVAAVRRHRGKIMTVGLCVGALMFLLTLIGTLFSGDVAGGLTPSFLISFVIGGLAGGLLNLKRKKHKHVS
jgi:putative membrane protein (TIGR04086 family)